MSRPVAVTVAPVRLSTVIASCRAAVRSVTRPLEVAAIRSAMLVSAMTLPQPITTRWPAASKPRITGMVVDFPALLGPTSPVTCPGSTVNDIPSSATAGPIVLYIVAAALAGLLAAIAPARRAARMNMLTAIAAE